MLRIVGAIVATWSLLAPLVLVHDAVVSQERLRATALVETARQAVAGRGAAVNSLILHGTATIGFDGATARPSTLRFPFEMRIVLPDRYLRVDRDQRRGLLRCWGFAGDVLLNHWSALRATARVSYKPRPEEISQQRGIFAHLILGMLARTDTPHGLQPLQLAGSDSIVLAGSSESSFVTLDVDPVKKLPLRVRYQDRLSIPQPLTREQRAAGVVPGPQPSEDVEVSLSFEDRRDTKGVQLPYRIVRSARGTVFEAIHIDEYVVDPKLDSVNCPDKVPN